MATLEDVTRDALGLELQERARLTEKLLESLDHLSEREVEALWLDEAERRLREYQEGRVDAVPGDQVFQEARDLLR